MPPKEEKNMTREEMQKYRDAKPVAVYSFGLCGIEILDIEYGINDAVIYRFCSGSEEVEKPHRARIYYSNNDRNYFLYNGRRIHLDECMRCGI